MATLEQTKDLKRLHRYVEREGLTSVMNNTKWRRLFESLERVCGLSFRRKDVRESPVLERRWDSDIYYAMAGWENIEWLDIRARISRHRGALVAPEIEDQT